MPVSIMQPPESVWGYEMVTAKYDEKPEESWKRIVDRVKECFPGTTDEEIVKLIGKRPV